MRYYAGIGSRKTPTSTLGAMMTAARALESLGWTLRTGGAAGADQAFFQGIKDYSLLELYIPWEGFNGFTGKDDPVHVLSSMAPSLRSEAFNLAQEHHPNWDALSDGAQLLMARNAFQVLGLDLQTPADCVICWTPGGRGEGGTGQAIRMAQAYDIPIIDLGKHSTEEAETMIGNIISKGN